MIEKGWVDGDAFIEAFEQALSFHRKKAEPTLLARSFDYVRQYETYLESDTMRAWRKKRETKGQFAFLSEEQDLRDCPDFKWVPGRDEEPVW
jgi:hypothetical protein